MLTELYNEINEQNLAAYVMSGDRKILKTDAELQRIKAYLSTADAAWQASLGLSIHLVSPRPAPAPPDSPSSRPMSPVPPAPLPPDDGSYPSQSES